MGNITSQIEKDFATVTEWGDACPSLVEITLPREFILDVPSDWRTLFTYAPQTLRNFRGTGSPKTYGFLIRSTPLGGLGYTIPSY